MQIMWVLSSGCHRKIESTLMYWGSSWKEHGSTQFLKAHKDTLSTLPCTRSQPACPKVSPELMAQMGFFLLPHTSTHPWAFPCRCLRATEHLRSGCGCCHRSHGMGGWKDRTLFSQLREWKPEVGVQARSSSWRSPSSRLVDSCVLIVSQEQGAVSTVIFLLSLLSRACIPHKGSATFACHHMRFRHSHPHVSSEGTQTMGP